MVEKFRLFVGSTELNYNYASIELSNDHIVDEGEATIEADGDVKIYSILDFRSEDGVTNIFSPQVQNITKTDLWGLTLFSNGYELNNIRVENVYVGMSPEAIVQDVVDNYTSNLTYASSTVSGVTIDKYIAKGYGIDVIRDMMDVLKWQIRIDENDNFYFEPNGEIDNGGSFTNGVDINITEWEEGKDDLVNHIKVIGGFESFFTTGEAKVGVDTVFSLDHKPLGSVRAVVGGNEVSPNDYTVDPESKTITFNSSQTNPSFDYSYSVPVVVESQNDGSIALYGEIYREVPAPWLNTFSDARRYAKQFLAINSVPKISAKGIDTGINLNFKVGEIVNLSDPIRGLSGQVVIVKIKYECSETGSTVYTFGSRSTEFMDWQREVQERIKKIERRSLNIDEVVFVRLFTHNLKVSLEHSFTWEYNSPLDTFYLNHKTLSRTRTVVNGHVLNFEADCSDNHNNGTWYGSGIDGSQFNTSGYRLSAGSFNGSDNYISVADDSSVDLSSDFSIALAIKVSSLPGAETYVLNKWDGTDGYAVRINSSNQMELIYSNSGVDYTITASTALTANTWQHVVFTKSGTDLIVYIDGVSDNTDTGGAAAGTNSNNLEIGRYSSNYFTGLIDEVRLYDSAITSSDVLKLKNKIHINNNNVCYLSMDNPRLGIRESARTTVT